MPPLNTNRDLYLAADALCRQHKSNPRPLEEYLLALLRLAQPFQHRHELYSNRVYRMWPGRFIGRLGTRRRYG
jgi:hypothetical protein